MHAYMHKREREIYFKKFAYATMGPGLVSPKFVGLAVTKGSLERLVQQKLRLW